MMVVSRHISLGLVKYFRHKKKLNSCKVQSTTKIINISKFIIVKIRHCILDFMEYWNNGDVFIESSALNA